MSIFQSSFDPNAPRYLAGMTLLIGACFLGGCALWDAANTSSDEARDVAQTEDTGSDTGASDATQDPGEDVGDPADTHHADGTNEPSGCRGESLETVMKVAPGSSYPQYQPSAAFDGSGIWVVYLEDTGANAGEDNSEHNIMATRVSCSGEQLPAPIQLNDTPVYLRNAKPGIAIKDGTVFFVWSTKQSLAAVNTSIMFRTYSTEGEALMEKPEVVEFDVEEKLGNWQDPAIIALSSTDAVISGTGSNDSGSRVFLKKVTALGESSGAAVPVHIDLEHLQRVSAVSVAASGDIWVAWQQTKIISSGPSDPWSTHYRSFDAATLEPLTEPKTVIKKTLLAATRPGISGPTEDSEHVYYVMSARSDTGPVVFLGNMTNDTGLSQVSENESQNIAPAVAAGQGGGMVVWFKVTESTQPYRIELYAQPFIQSHDNIEQHTPRILATFPTLLRNQRLPGGPSVVPVGAEDYFVVWNQNSEPYKSTLHASFIRY